jgi:hypothetical protein
MAVLTCASLLPQPCLRQRLLTASCCTTSAPLTPNAHSLQVVLAAGRPRAPAPSCRPGGPASSSLARSAAAAGGVPSLATWAARAAARAARGGAASPSPTLDAAPLTRLATQPPAGLSPLDVTAAAGSQGGGRLLPSLQRLLAGCGGDLRRSLLAGQMWWACPEVAPQSGHGEPHCDAPPGEEAGEASCTGLGAAAVEAQAAAGGRGGPLAAAEALVDAVAAAAAGEEAETRAACAAPEGGCGPVAAALRRLPCGPLVLRLTAGAASDGHVTDDRQMQVPGDGVASQAALYSAAADASQAPSPAAAAEASVATPAERQQLWLAYGEVVREAECARMAAW